MPARDADGVQERVAGARASLPYARTGPPDPRAKGAQFVEEGLCVRELLRDVKPSSPGDVRT